MIISKFTDDVNLPRPSVPSWAIGLLASPDVCSDLTGVPLATVEDLAARRAVETQLRNGTWFVNVGHVVTAAGRRARERQQ
jgi:hypothetical protein